MRGSDPGQSNEREELTGKLDLYRKKKNYYTLESKVLFKNNFYSHCELKWRLALTILHFRVSWNFKILDGIFFHQTQKVTTMVVR